MTDTLGTFTATDQHERELLWDALEHYRATLASEENLPTVVAMIARVSNSFSWMHHDDTPTVYVTPETVPMTEDDIR